MQKIKNSINPLLVGLFCGLSFFPNNEIRRKRFNVTPDAGGFASDKSNLIIDINNVYEGINKSFKTMS